jgi:hypothetical protein
LVEVGFGVKSADMRIKRLHSKSSVIFMLPISIYLSIYLSYYELKLNQKKPHEVAIWGVTSVYNLKWLSREDEKFKVSVIATHW